MFDWLRTRSRRDLVLSLVIAGAFALLVGTVIVSSSRSVHVAEYVFEDAHEGGLLFDRGFEVAPGARLLVEVSDVDVAIATSRGSTARVRVALDDDETVPSDLLDRLGFSIERTSEGLEIRTESDRHGRRSDHDDYDLRLDIRIPARFDVFVRTGDGDVTVAGVEGIVQLQTGDGDIALGSASGPEVTIRTGDGDVSLGAVSSRVVQVQTGDGDVALGNLEAGEVTIRTGDGDIATGELFGSLRASTGDGDVVVRIGAFRGLEISTGDGDVTIVAPADLAADLDLIGEEFLLGDSFALPAQLDTRRLRGPLNGGGAPLSVRVGDGTIRLIER